MTRRRFRKRASGLYVPGPWRPTRLSTLGSHEARGQFSYHVGDPASQVALPTAANLVLDGSFRVPLTGWGSGTTYGFQGTGRGSQHVFYYDPNGNGGYGSLYVQSSRIDPEGPNVAEIDIPDQRSSGAQALVQGNNVNGGSTNQSSLPYSNIVQPFGPLIGSPHGYGDPSTHDPYYGSGIIGGGIVIRGNYIYGNCYPYFNGGNYGNVYRRPKDLSITNQWKGWCSLHIPSWPSDLSEYGQDIQGFGCASGCMAEIPPSMQSLFGGRSVLSGLAGVSINSRCSFGPMAAAWEPTDIDGATTVTVGGTLASPQETFAAWIASQGFTGHTAIQAKVLVGFPNTHQTLGPWDDSDLDTGGQLILHYRSSPFRRPYVNWNEIQCGMFCVDNAVLFPTMYGVGWVDDGAGGQLITAYYGPTSRIKANTGTYDIVFNGSPIALTDVVLSAANGNRVNCVAGTTTLTSDGTPFTAGQVGAELFINGGANFVTGIYIVGAFNSSSSIEVHNGAGVPTDPTNGSNASGGVGAVGGDLGVATYDPILPERNGHSPYAHPYRFRLTGIRASDMVDVYNGVKQAWDLIPYTNAEFTMPFGIVDHYTQPLLVAWDANRRKVYFLQADLDQSDSYALITRFSFIQS